MAASADGIAVFKPGDITIRKFLGGGGFGGVSLASHKSWGDVAVKEFNKITVNEEIFKEAKKMWRVLPCPYLVSIMGIIEDPGNPLSIVMEYLEYGDLMRFNRKFMMGCNCWARKIKMIQEISLGMNFLHTQDNPVIHRDLKLENVFVGTGFIVKIGDLGLALGSKTMQDMYKVSVAGTFSHIPPEGWGNTEHIPDKFWDIFTFAITSFELLSGKDPWLEHADAALVSVWLQTGKRPNLEHIPADAPAEITTLMERCWNGTPSQRPEFQEIQEVVSNVYRSQFEASIRKADKAIIDRIDVSNELDQLEAESSTVDSGVDSNFWGSFGTKNVKDNATKEDASNVVNTPSTPKDSGIDIQKVASNINRNQFEASIQKEERTIDRVDVVSNDLAQQKADSSTADSGVDSNFWEETFGAMNVKDNATKEGASSVVNTPSTPKDSGIALSQWTPDKEIHPRHKGKQLTLLRYVACCPNGDMVIAPVGKKLYILGVDGKCKTELVVPITIRMRKKQMDYVRGIAVSSQGHILVVDGTRYVKVFDMNGKYLHCFEPLPEDEDHKIVPYAWVGIAIDREGCVLFADVGKLIIIQTYPDGKMVKRLNDANYYHIVVNSKKQILHISESREVVVTDYKGRKVVTFTPTTEGCAHVDHTVKIFTVGIVCDACDNIYIALRMYDSPDKGHLHKYSPTGVFLECIARGLDGLNEMSISSDGSSLVVVKEKSVLIYRLR